MEADTKKSLDRRLARLEGQVAGLRRMLSQDRYCVEILTQVAAVRAALDQVGAELVTSHMKTCVMGHGSGSEHADCRRMSQDEVIEEFRLALSRLMK